MTSLATLLRSARPADPATDADLLDRYRASRDADAFAELLRRHGRLVWAACRHQTRTEADADDAFQAVWLALARNPAVVREPTKLSAFLHGVAVRVCGKQRAANQRRANRERTVAVADGAVAVPDSAWDRALAAVHEEVARLPEPLRVAFVRCGLEGQGVSEAAADLGWKLGTLSGRLTRAKDLLTKRLDARGLTAGAVVATACGGAVPAAVAGRAMEVAAGTVPASILTLSQGVIGMDRVKLLAAALVLTGGLGAGVGGGWLAGAGAQDSPPPKPKPAVSKPVAEKPPAKWEYHYHAELADHVYSPAEFQKLVESMEADGWTLLGTIQSSALGGRRPTLVFRRPVKPATAKAVAENLDWLIQHNADAMKPFDQTLLRYLNLNAANSNSLPTSRDQRIAELEKELERLRGEKPYGAVVFAQKELPLGASELRDVFDRLARKRYGDDALQLVVTDRDGGGLQVSGDWSRIEWIWATLRSMGANLPESPPRSKPAAPESPQPKAVPAYR